jgi:ABC-2 type transport system ATP-binding protein
MATALEFIDVSKRFGSITVLSHIDLSIDAGSIVGLIGDNGAGKTTLLRLAARILTANEGTVRVFGETDPIASRRQLGAFLERPGHYDELTVEDNLRFFYSFYGATPRELRAVVAHALEEFGLAQVRAAIPGRLSTGYRQRLAVARAAHPWARLVLLDEPLESLDPIARGQLKQQLLALKRDDRALVVSSHTLTDLAQICDRLLLVADGRVHAFDSFQAIQEAVGPGAPEDLDLLYTQLRRRHAAGKEAH